MIPLRDDNPTRTFAWCTVYFITINVFVFLYEISLPEHHELATHDVGARVAAPGQLRQKFGVAPTLAQPFDRVRGIAEPRLGAEVETRHGWAPGGCRPDRLR